MICHACGNEVSADSADSAQLGRICRAINQAMPHFTSAMGCECDHAESALAAMIQERAELLAALQDILAAYHGLTLGAQDTSWEGKFKVAARAAILKAKGAL